jgi:hypothetical protein
MDFSNSNPQTTNNLLAMLIGGGPQGYRPEDRVNSFFKNFGVQDIDPVTKAKAMQLLVRSGINMPMSGAGTAGVSNSGGMTLNGSMPNYPVPNMQY